MTSDDSRKTDPETGASTEGSAASSPDHTPATPSEASASDASASEASARQGSDDSTPPAETATAESTTAEAVAAESATTEAESGSAQSESGTAEAAPSEEGTAPSGAEETAAPTSEAAADGAKKKKRRRKKKKPGDGNPRAHERAPFHIGEEVFGKVTAVLETAIMIDLSGKALAIFDRSEMAADDLVPEVGDRFVGQVLSDGSRGGLVVMSRQLLREEEAKPKVEQAAKDGTLVEGLVTGVIKGGVEVLIDGLRAFAPASGVDLHPRTANFTNLVGQRLEFKVATYEKQGREVVVTRRPMLEKEAHERRKKAREVIQEGMEMQGIVRTIVDWGAFVALPEAENLEGLVHISELSHDPRDKIADVLKPGQKLKVQIQKIDEKGKIWLSRKALIEDPFQQVLGGLEPGAEIEGEITRVEEFGAFVKLADGFEGLCHAADLSLERVNDARTVVQPGQKMKMVVHHIDPRQRRVALHPALSEEHAGEEKQKVQKGTKLKVQVHKVDKPGLVVRIKGATGRQARGFIPAGQTATQRGSELRKHFNVGQELEVLVTEIDAKRSEAKLSISRLHQDEERKAHKEYRAKLKKEANFGTLGDLLKNKFGG